MVLGGRNSFLVLWRKRWPDGEDSGLNHALQLALDALNSAAGSRKDS